MNTDSTYDFRRELDDLMEEMDFYTLKTEVMFIICRVENECEIYSLEIVRNDRDENNRANYMVDALSPEHYGIGKTFDNVAREMGNPYKFEYLPFGFVAWLSDFSDEFKLMAQCALM